MTGILTGTGAVAALLHARGALSFWDYAAAGPYLPIRVAASAPGAGDHKDAVFLSPHKFPGGPQTPGVLVVRRDLVRNTVPTAPGGGTVAFVDPIGHQYLDDPVAREEGGTPAIIESIRAGLVFALKQAVGTDLIAAREERLWRHVLHRWAGSPGIEVLGSHQAARLAVISFRIRHGARYLHHNFVVALLNDLFGIQARGGCSCAGPYGHRLLAIGPARSHALREEIGHGCDGVKPGWTRVNLNYFISGATAGYIAAAVELIAADGYRLLPDYRFDPRTGLWRHAAGPPRPPITLADVGYGPDGEMDLPPAPRPGRRGGLPRLPGAGPRHPGRPARPPRLRDPPGCHPNSRRCAGSRCPRRALRASQAARPGPADDQPPPGPPSVPSGLPYGLTARRAARDPERPSSPRSRERPSSPKVNGPLMNRRASSSPGRSPYPAPFHPAGPGHLHNTLICNTAPGRYREKFSDHGRGEDSPSWRGDVEARPGPNSGAGCREATSHCAIGGQNGLMRVIATRIEPDGTMQRRMVDTARQSDRRLWEDLAARAVGIPVPYRPAPGIAVYHIRLDDYVVMAAEHDLAGPLLDLVTAVMALGSEC